MTNLPRIEPVVMVGLVFSLDYEIYGTGQGDFNALMVEPSERILELFDEYGARLTIMAEVAEILALRNHDRFGPVLERIEEQLRGALAGGHDVQLHLHPAWFNARFEGGSWMLDFDEYALVGLPRSRIADYVQRGKRYLEGLARQVRPDYRCVAFRAGNWLTQPSRDLIACLEEAGLLYDSSVFKNGWGRVGHYTVDYRAAHNDLFAWTVDPSDINSAADRSGLREIPIFTRRVLAPSMLTLKRLRMQLRLRRESRARADSSTPAALGTGEKVGRTRLLYPRKFDFCRMTFREMRSYVRHAVRRCRDRSGLVPVVAIGHSTEFQDDNDLRRLLEYTRDRCRGEVVWTTFSECAAAGL